MNFNINGTRRSNNSLITKRGTPLKAISSNILPSTTLNYPHILISSILLYSLATVTETFKSIDIHIIWRR